MVALAVSDALNQYKNRKMRSNMNLRQTPDLVTLLAEQRIIRHPLGLSVVAAVREELKAQSSPGQDAEFLRLPGPYNT